MGTRRIIKYNGYEIEKFSSQKTVSVFHESKWVGVANSIREAKSLIDREGFSTPKCE